MIKDYLFNIDHLYDRNHWVLPKTYFNNEKNEGFKLRVCPTKYNKGWWFWAGTEKLKYNFIEIISKSGEKHVETISIKNILEILSTHDSYPDGLLKGSFILSPKRFSPECTLLIPEDSMEAKVKKIITQTYYDPKIPWKSKVIPGHLYLSKSGNLYLAWNKLENYYCVSTYQSGMNYYSRLPIKAKGLLHLDSHLVYNLPSYTKYTDPELKERFRFSIFSGTFLVKDLGKCFEDEDYLSTFTPTIENYNESFYYFFQSAFTRDEVKDALRTRVTETSYTSTNVLNLKFDLGVL